MVIEDQSEVIAFLSTPSTHGGENVERVETHTAIVFLVGSHAYKLKRAVRFDYVDFSTLARRQECCEAEVRLNRRTAPALYRGVVAVVRTAAGALALAEDGNAVEWLVEMNRFDQSQLLDQLAAIGQLDLETASGLGVAVATFHQAADHRHDHGGRAGMAWVIDGNAEGFAEFVSEGLDPTLAARVTSAARVVLDRRAILLESRRRKGLVRQCHGDLHLRNIVMMNGQPTLFDAVEFNDEISCIDVFYDLAFLLMDLGRRRLPGHANTLINRYVAESGDLDGLALLPLFLSCRAAVRAKTSAAAARLQDDAGRRSALQQTAGEYLALADRLLRPAGPCLIAIGGFSGSGKSTVALGLAPGVGAPPGAMVFRSDEIRKRLCGVPLGEPLGPEGYSPEVSSRVYEKLIDYARTTVRSGHAAIVDAVHGDPEQRMAIEQVAADASVPFFGCWLDAPESTLIDRVERRPREASDADAAVVRLQRNMSIGPLTWHRIDASLTADAVIAQVSALVAGWS